MKSKTKKLNEYYFYFQTWIFFFIIKVIFLILENYFLKLKMNACYSLQYITRLNVAWFLLVVNNQCSNYIVFFFFLMKNIFLFTGINIILNFIFKNNWFIFHKIFSLQILSEVHMHAFYKHVYRILYYIQLLILQYPTL